LRNSYITSSEEETFLLGYHTACRFKNFKTFILVGDLGVGKTVFVRGFCEYHGVDFVPFLGSSPYVLVEFKFLDMERREIIISPRPS
jgi:tRNA A37 threonylcarbamoyladenosine biosynthesis protein TsaE